MKQEREETNFERKLREEESRRKSKRDDYVFYFWGISLLISGLFSELAFFIAFYSMILFYVIRAYVIRATRK